MLYQINTNVMVINKKASKICKFLEVLVIGTIFIGTGFVSSITLSHVINELLHTLCSSGFLQSQQYLLFHSWFELYFLPSNLHSHLHDVCFVKVFDSFISVMMLKTSKCKSSVSFGTHAILDRSSRVLQLLIHLSN